jgi:hypothetical protein
MDLEHSVANKNLMLDLFNALSSNVEENSLSTVTSMLSDKGVSGVNVCEVYWDETVGAVWVDNNTLAIPVQVLP